MDIILLIKLTVKDFIMILYYKDENNNQQQIDNVDKITFKIVFKIVIAVITYNNCNNYSYKRNISADLIIEII